MHTKATPWGRVRGTSVRGYKWCGPWEQGRALEKRRGSVPASAFPSTGLLGKQRGAPFQNNGGPDWGELPLEQGRRHDVRD